MPHRDHSPARGTNPFLAPGDDDFFYATAQITQRLNLLHHLGRYSDQVMVLTGPEGSGKTTLTDRLLREGQNAWRATVVEAHVETSAEQLLARALAGLDVHGSIITEKDGLDALQTHLAAAARGGLPTLLVVDDAQFLAAPVLKLLLRLARHPDYPGLRLLLVGDPAFADRVAGALGETIFHLVELPPFGQEQCMHYITMRLDRSGTPAHDLFTAERVDRLWKDSGGYPGPLNRLAARIIEKPARPATPAATRAPRTAPPTRTRTMARSARGNRRLLAVIGGAALLLTLAITALLPEGSDERDTGLTRPLPAPAATERAVSAPDPETTPQATTAPATRTTTPVDEAAPDPPSPGPSAGADGQTGPAPGAAPEVPAPETPAQTADPTARDSEAEPIARTQPPPQEPAAPREPVEEPPAPTAETPPAPPPADSEAAPTSETPPPRPPRPRPAPPPSWPFNLAEDRYVLQLMGSHERASVARLITRHELEDPSAVVDLVHEGRPWYVLIHGAYASRDEAVGAIRRLAPELRALRPWARSVASLRANLSPHPP